MREFPSTAANDLIGGLLATQPGLDAARVGNQLAQSPPNPYLLIRSLGLDSRKVYLYRAGQGDDLPGSAIAFDPNSDQFFDTDDRFKAGYSTFGTPIISNCVISAPGHRNPSTGASISPSSIVLDVVLHEVTQERNIVTTPVNGRDGTVKEYISDGDYAISLKGKIVGLGYLYPLVAVQNLLKVCRAKIAVDVESPYLREVFGITRMVIASDRLWQEEGVEGEQMFEIMALSESALETELATQ
jgi:hypothetical protein